MLQGAAHLAGCYNNYDCPLLQLFQTEGRARGEPPVSCYTFSETGMGAITPWTSRGHVNSEVIECTTRKAWGD
jgi:hypothetical protein